MLNLGLLLLLSLLSWLGLERELDEMVFFSSGGWPAD